MMYIVITEKNVDNFRFAEICLTSTILVKSVGTLEHL